MSAAAVVVAVTGQTQEDSKSTDAEKKYIEFNSSDFNFKNYYLINLCQFINNLSFKLSLKNLFFLYLDPGGQKGTKRPWIQINSFG